MLIFFNRHSDHDFRARRSAAPLRASLVEVSLNTDPLQCMHLTDTVTRPIVNLYRGGTNGEVSACAIAGFQICLTRKTILPMIVM